MQGRLKTLLTRALTFTLSLTLTLSPLSYLHTEHAHDNNVTDPGNTGGGGGSMGTTTDPKAWSGDW